MPVNQLKITPENLKAINYFMIFLGVYIGISGFLEFSYVSNVLVQDKFIRALSIVYIFCCIIFLLIFLFPLKYIKINILNPSKLQLASVLLFLSGIVGSVIYEDFNGASQSVRFLSYFMLFCFFNLIVKYYGVEKAKRLLLKLLIPILVIAIAAGLYDIVFHVGLNMNGAFRIGGSIGSPVGYACLIYIGVFSYVLMNKCKLVLPVIITTIMASFIVVYTGTRSVAVGFFVSILIVVFFRGKVSLIKAVGFVGFIASIIVLLYLTIDFSNTELINRFDGLASGNLAADSSTSFRLFVIEQVIDNFQSHHLVFGYGMGGFPVWFNENTGVDNVAPHFEILWLFFEFGIMGFLIYMYLIYSAVKSISRNFYSGAISRQERLLAVLIVFSHMLWFQFANPFYFYQFGLLYFSVLGIYTGNIKTYQVKLHNNSLIPLNRGIPARLYQ